MMSTEIGASMTVEHGRIGHPQRTALLWLIVIGGAAVLGSYAWGFVARAEAMNALWGGVPESARGLYTVNMFLAAAGFMLFSRYLCFQLDPARARFAGRFGFGWLMLPYALILIPSALWLPLTDQMVQAPSSPLWLAIRLDLALVACGSLGIVAALLVLDAPRPRGRALALLGCLPFCLQTAVLDALIWPAYYPAMG